MSLYTVTYQCTTQPNGKVHFCVFAGSPDLAREIADRKVRASRSDQVGAFVEVIPGVPVFEKCPKCDKSRLKVAWSPETQSRSCLACGFTIYRS